MQNEAENDSAYSDLACKGQSTQFFAATQYRGFEVGCKPCSGAPGNALQYPRHEEFNRRISIQQFQAIQKDLQQELYNRSGYFACLGGFCLGSTSADRGRAVTFEALHTVLSYYNRVLFHPMLIDAQVFAPRQGRRDYFVGFLVASSSDEYLSFKRPVLGKSRGYLNPSVTRNVNIRPETGYSVPETVPSAAPTPPSFHSREARSYAAPPPSAHMIRVPETFQAPGAAACPPELAGRPVATPAMAAGYGPGYSHVAPAGGYGAPYQPHQQPHFAQSAPAPASSAAPPVTATVVYPAVQAPLPQVMAHHQETQQAPVATAQPV